MSNILRRLLPKIENAKAGKMLSNAWDANSKQLERSFDTFIVKDFSFERKEQSDKGLLVFDSDSIIEKTLAGHN